MGAASRLLMDRCMKTTMRNVKAGLAALTVAMTAMGGTAWAGWRYSQDVVVDTLGMSAYGQIGRARNSTDSVQYLYCMTQAYAGSSTPQLLCGARSLSAVQWCSTREPALVAAATGINGDSWVSFTWNTSGQCTSLTVTNGSQHEAKE